jgi:hypothetical protein
MISIMNMYMRKMMSAQHMIPMMSLHWRNFMSVFNT